MRSKTSFFDKGLCLNCLKRYWPLWTGWFALLLIMLPGRIPGFMTGRNATYIVQRIDRHLLQSGVDLAMLSFIIAVMAAMAMFSHLYNSRSCSMINSLPLRRETVFLTAFFTGLVPLLLAELIAVGITGLMISGIEGVDMGHLLTLLGCAVFCTVGFYGMAVFCAMLTGNIVVLPAIYVLLNVAATLAESAVNTVLNQFVYGFIYSKSTFIPASPATYIVDRLMVNSKAQETFAAVDGPVAVFNTESAIEYYMEGFWMLAVYCAVGILLAGLALRLYKRRAMESVGDVVAIPVLKPIFKYTLSLGVGFCFAALVFNMVFDSLTYGITEAAAILVLLLIGAFIGYFAAEMLMQKTLRVFRGKWKGYIITAAALVLFVTVWETDLTGYERRVPEVNELESVEISYAGLTELSEPENLSFATDYHSQLIDAKAINEQAELFETLVINYNLNNGRTISRYYNIADARAQHEDESSNINVLGLLLNVQEAIDSRAATDVPVTERSVVNAFLNVHWVDEQGEYHAEDVELSGKQMAELYTDCLLPDSKEGLMCRIWPVRNEDYYATVSNVNLSFGVLDLDKSLSPDDSRHYYYDFTVYTDASRCCEWIEENTRIDILPLGVANPRQMSDDLEYYGITHG